MSKKSHNARSSKAASNTAKLCFICKEAAVGVGPFSKQHLCQHHLDIDVANVRKLQLEVQEQLQPYSTNVQEKMANLLNEQREIDRQLKEMEAVYASVWQTIESRKTHVAARRDALQTCVANLNGLLSMSEGVVEAEAAGDRAQAWNLATLMQLSVPHMQADFARAHQLRSESESSAELQKIQQMLAGLSTSDVGVTAHPETNDAAAASGGAGAADWGQIVVSHELILEDCVSCVTVCSDTTGFRGDCSGRVVPAESAGDGSGVALPQPCLIVSVKGKDHLTVMSVDGKVKLRCHCPGINWNESHRIHSDRRLLFIAQNAAVTVTDLSGHPIRQIHPDLKGKVNGIGGNVASVFVSSGNSIVAFSKATGQLELVIELTQLPDAQLGNMVLHDDCILVTDWKQDQVHRVRIDTQQLLATHPTPRAGIARFKWPQDVAVDSRGRMFVCEHLGHSVRAVAPDDGSLLWTLGVPGESGSGGDRLDQPCGLAVVTEGPCEQLVVADCRNKRLLVLNLL